MLWPRFASWGDSGAGDSGIADAGIADTGSAEASVADTRAADASAVYIVDESPSDDSLLDAYSGAVIGALERVAPAVTFIEVEQRTAIRSAPCTT